MNLAQRHSLTAIDALAEAERAFVADEITYQTYRAAADRVATEKAKVPGADQLRIKQAERSPA